MGSEAEICRQSDELYSQGKREEAFTLLAPYSDGGTTNVELLWRVVRMHFRRSGAAGGDKGLAEKALEISKKCADLGGDNFLCMKVIKSNEQT